MKGTKKLLIIGFVWPEPNSSAAGGRMMQLISMFTNQGYEIIFASPAQDSDFMADLSEFGVQKVSVLLNDSSFDHFITDLQPQAVLFDRFMMEEQFGWRVAEQCPDALRILDTEDLHCLRLARQKAFKSNRTFEVTDLFDEEVAKREIASILRSDLSLMVSEYEMKLLTSVFKIDKALLHYLPLVINGLESEILSFGQRKNIMFIGNFLHKPNWNAVQYLKESIWPLIKQELPELCVEIYGAYPSQKVFQLHNEKEGFVIKGRAENAKNVISNARLLVAPLRFGAGIKGKLIEAMQFGTPSVTTSIGAEAMQGNLEWNGFVTDDATEFAVAVVRLYQDENLWKISQENGFELLKKRYLKSLFEPHFAEKISFLQNHLKQHRQHNFLGQMLHHHSLQSTKYMSRWIEEKNKK